MRETGYACAECGEHVMDARLEEMLFRCVCFHCNFWLNWVERLTHPDYENHIARINGNHYLIAAEDAFAVPRGFSGTRFAILFKDGRRVETTNLYHNGIIPLRFRNRLPDNAAFVPLYSLKEETADADL